MRILIATESFLPRSNGVTNSVIKSSSNLKRMGHEVLILAPGKGPLSVDGIKVERVPSIAINSLAQIDLSTIRTRELVSKISNFQPDIIHLASPFLLGDQVRRAALITDTPIVAIYQTDVTGFAFHYGFNAMSNFAERRIKKIHSQVNLTLAPSSQAKKYLVDMGIKNIEIWGRGVDNVQFNSNRRSTSLRATWGADENTVVIGYVGRLAPEKRVENLKALRDIGALTGTKLKLVVVGDGLSRERLEKLLPGAIFTGHKQGNDLGSTMASLDILISTGENETFCQVIQEGFASGIPVIAPAVGGPVDLVSPGENGLLYHPGSLFELRRSALKLIGDKQFRISCGKNGQEMVKSRSWQALTEILVVHYQNVIENHKRKTNREISA